VHRKLLSLSFIEKARGEDSLLQQPRNDGDAHVGKVDDELDGLDAPMVFFAKSTSYWPIACIESGPSRIRPHDVAYAQDSCALAAYGKGDR
jgi:hypothetical protein